MSRPDELPDFARPPIDEVALGLSFLPIDGFNDAHAGLYWRLVRDEYPRTQGRPRSETPVEDLSTATALPAAPTFELVGPNESIGGRTWLVSEDDSALLQVQNTQFLRNWRRRENDYPHLDEHIDRFWAAFDKFNGLLAEDGLAEPVLKQVELSYFNWITPHDVSVFRPAHGGSLSLGGLGPEPEEVRAAFNYLDRNDEDETVGRLRVEFQPAARPKQEPETEIEFGHQLLLSYRVPVDRPTREDLNRIIRRGRAVIDYSFVDLTSEAAHERWGRIK